MILRLFVCFFFTLFLEHPARAEDERIINLIKQAEIKNLAYSSYWDFLMHYQHSYFEQSGVRSEVHTDQFFLSPNGKTDPVEELNATIRAFFSFEDKNPDAHPQCRFKARYKWLKKSLDWQGIDLPEYECPGYKKWSYNGKVQTISLIFATGYLGSPASYFGHPLLKFNLSPELGSTNLLDPALNYGALTPDKENPFVYAFKGLFGGYDGGFTHQFFFYNNHNYSETELRDMWEYELDLTKEQVELIVSHTWELLGNKFTYLFLYDNCASRMAQLLEFVIDQPLLPRHVPYAIPHTVFERLASAKKEDGAPIVTRIARIPSRQTRLNEKYAFLSDEEQKIINEIVSSAATLQKDNFQNLSVEEKSKVLETLFDYYSFREVSDKAENKKYQEVKRQLLAERLKLPSQKFSWEEVKVYPPSEGQRAVLSRFSFFQSRIFGDGVELRLRPAYYDFLSLETGRLPNASLSIFDLKLAAAANNFWVRQMDFIGIETLNISQTGLPGDGGYAWNFKAGVESLDLGCTSCLTFRIDGGVGKAAQINTWGAIYGMLEGRIQTPALESGTLALTPRLGALVTFSEKWKSHLLLGQRTYLNGSQTKLPIVSWENRFGNSRFWDIRLSYEEHVDQEVKASFSYYW